MKRVYAKVAVVPDDDGFSVVLDRRPARTPMGAALAVPAFDLARAIAAEWDAQVARVDPQTMPMTRLAAVSLDVVGGSRCAVVGQVVGYGATDLVCYRAERPPALVERQGAAWDPLVDWARTTLDAPLRVTQGVVPVAQPDAALDALRRAVEACDDWRLAALASATATAGSVVIGLALTRGRIDAAEAWRASQVDEAFAIEQWGEIAEAATRHAALGVQIAEARRFLDLLEG